MMTMTYQSLMKYISKAKNPVKGRPVGKATRLKMQVIDGTPVVDVVYHKTVIVRMTPTEIVINNGGYYTLTTAKRINQYLPAGCSVRRRDGSWHYVNHWGEGVFNFSEKMTIDHEGWVLAIAN
jgi:hypothetical protein